MECVCACLQRLSSTWQPRDVPKMHLCAGCIHFGEWSNRSPLVWSVQVCNVWDISLGLCNSIKTDTCNSRSYLSIGHHHHHHLVCVFNIGDEISVLAAEVCSNVHALYLIDSGRFSRCCCSIRPATIIYWHYHYSISISAVLQFSIEQTGMHLMGNVWHLNEYYLLMRIVAVIVGMLIGHKRRTTTPGIDISVMVACR